MRALAEQEYEAVRNSMYEVSKGIYAVDHPYTTFPDAPDETFKQVIINAANEMVEYSHDLIVNIPKAL